MSCRTKKKSIKLIPQNLEYSEIGKMIRAAFPKIALFFNAVLGITFQQSVLELLQLQGAVSREPQRG